MNDIIEFIDEIKSLQALYNEGELRNFDFESVLSKYERQFAQFEAQFELQHNQIFKDAFYAPANEV